MYYKESMYNVEIMNDNSNRVLIFNTNNSALSWISEGVYALFRGKNKIRKDEIPEDIIRLGFVVDNNKDEFASLEFEKNVYIYNEQPPIMGFVVAPTLSCNMNCQYCFENDVQNKTSMDIEDADRVVSFIKRELDKVDNVQRLWIRWFGGEPSLAINIIKYISRKLISYCENRKIHYSSMIISNGFLLNKEIALILKNECKVNRVQITIDGMADMYSQIKRVSKETFEVVVNNIVCICDILYVIVRINLSKDNKKDIQDLVYYLLEEKKLANKIWIYFERVREFDFNRSDSIIDADECENFKSYLLENIVSNGYIDSLLHYLPQRNLFSCSAMQSMSATIGPDCNLYRCDNCLGKPKYKIGTCEEGFYRNSTEMMFINHQYNDKCTNCELLPICGGGCLEELIIQKRENCCEAVLSKLRTNIKLFMQYHEKKGVEQKYGKSN